MYSIIKATENDTEKLCRLGIQTFTDAYKDFNSEEDLEEYFDKSFSYDTLLKELKNPNTGYYLCYDNEKIMGYLKLNFNKSCEAFDEKNVTELQRIYVLKEYYRQKAGKQIMQFAMDVCKAKNFEYLWLGVWKENQTALSFYHYFGFETIGERGFQVGSKKYEDYYLRKKL